jgi:hypothetical protein
VRSNACAFNNGMPRMHARPPHNVAVGRRNHLHTMKRGGGEFKCE